MIKKFLIPLVIISFYSSFLQTAQQERPESAVVRALQALNEPYIPNPEDFADQPLGQLMIERELTDADIMNLLAAELAEAKLESELSEPFLEEAQIITKELPLGTNIKADFEMRENSQKITKAAQNLIKTILQKNKLTKEDINQIKKERINAFNAMIKEIVNANFDSYLARKQELLSKARWITHKIARDIKELIEETLMVKYATDEKFLILENIKDDLLTGKLPNGKSLLFEDEKN